MCKGIGFWLSRPFALRRRHPDGSEHGQAHPRDEGVDRPKQRRRPRVEAASSGRGLQSICEFLRIPEGSGLIYICVYIDMHACIHTYIHPYVYIYIYIHTNTHIEETLYTVSLHMTEAEQAFLKKPCSPCQASWFAEAMPVGTVPIYQALEKALLWPVTAKTCLKIP